jgi:hypothetical protein
MNTWHYFHSILLFYASTVFFNIQPLFFNSMKLICCYSFDCLFILDSYLICILCVLNALHDCSWSIPGFVIFRIISKICFLLLLCCLICCLVNLLKNNLCAAEKKSPEVLLPICSSLPNYLCLLNKFKQQDCQGQDQSVCPETLHKKKLLILKETL